MQPSVVPRGKLVVAHPERKAQRSLQRLVGATLCPVEVVDNIDALVAAKTKRLAGALPADAATRARLARKTKRVQKRMQVLLARKFAGAASPG